MNKELKWFLIILLIWWLLSSCNQKVCPAFEKYTPQAQRKFAFNAKFVNNAKCKPPQADFQQEFRKELKEIKKRIKRDQRKICPGNNH